MTRKSFPRTVLLVWALFLTRATFYCVMMPLWEGWDEYAHFARLDHALTHNRLPHFDDPMAREIEESLRLAPLSDELRWMGPPHLTYEDWWALPEPERAARMKRLRELPPEFARQPSDTRANFYEAQQPPLYYWLISLLLRFVASWNLTSRVLLVRLLSALLASLAIPFTWLAARRLLNPQSALIAAGLLAVAPGFAIDTFRVANDSLAIALFALTLFLLVRSESTWLQMGTAIGAALLAKAYMLVLLPILILSWFHRKRDLFPALALALSIGGWWYARNLLLGYSLSGWLEHTSTPRLIESVVKVNWLLTLDIIGKSFLWFGGWSFLTLKSWMYFIVEWTGMAAIALALYRQRGTLLVPAIACTTYLAAMLYGALTYYGVHASVLPGWYAWPAGASLAIFVAGGPRVLSAGLIGSLAVMDLYGAMAVLAPYYAGLVPRNRANLSVLIEALGRLHVPVVLLLCWAVATIAIPFAVCNKMGAQKSADGKSTGT